MYGPPLRVDSRKYCGLNERIYFYIPDNKGKNQKRFMETVEKGAEFVLGKRWGNLYCSGTFLLLTPGNIIPEFPVNKFTFFG
jgi:hypothetical protein